VKKGILFFADRLPPLTGGMEMHASYFIEHFNNHSRFPLLGVITKNKKGENIVVSKQGKYPVDFKPSFVFFNSGRWIEELDEIRLQFPEAIFLYRTGGNEILKAPLVDNQMTDHTMRQVYWAKTLNNVIDLMITNSAYTEKRLCDVGINCSFFRSVGGVNASALKPSKVTKGKSFIIFSAARFVPYKNHSLLVSVVGELVLRGLQLKVRLAGDGPLLDQIKKQVEEAGLTSIVTFLGVLDNAKACHEISKADVYMQLSGDLLTNVPGGSYVHSEGMGRSILEALTAGTFVIAGNSGALPEIVTEKRGLLVDLNNVEHLVDVVERALRTLPPRRAFDPNYCWTKIFREYEVLFDDAI